MKFSANIDSPAIDLKEINPLMLIFIWNLKDFVLIKVFLMQIVLFTKNVFLCFLDSQFVNKMWWKSINRARCLKDAITYLFVQIGSLFGQSICVPVEIYNLWIYEKFNKKQTIYDISNYINPRQPNKIYLMKPRILDGSISFSKNIKKYINDFLLTPLT